MSKFIRNSHYRNLTNKPLDKYPSVNPGEVVGDVNLLSCGSGGAVAYKHENGNVAIAYEEAFSASTSSLDIRAVSFDFSPTDGSLAVLKSDGLLSRHDITNAATVTSIQTSPNAINLLHHPSAETVIAVRSKTSISLTGGDSVVSTYDTPSQVTSFSYSPNGSSLLLSHKDKTVATLDPRSPSPSSLASPHQGSKPVTILSLTASHYVTTGQSMMRDRELSLWDARSTSKPLQRSRLDTGNGLLTPLFCPDSNLVYLAGKGDLNLRIYEFQNNELHPISNEALGGDPIRSVCLMPRRDLDIMDCEAARVFKLSDKDIVPISFKVPRRDKSRFVTELYPPSAVLEPAISLEEYLNNKDSSPKLGSLEPTKKESVKPPPPPQEVEQNPPPVSVSSPTSPRFSSSARFANNASKYRHVYGKQAPKSGTYYNLTPTVTTSDSSLLAANERFFAIPYKGIGRVYTSTLDRVGKVEPNCDTLNTGHTKAVTTLQFSPFNSTILATGSDDTNIKIFDLSDANIGCLSTLSAHRNSVRTLDFHPTSSNVLASSGTDQAVNIWDINASNPILSLSDQHPESINNVTWDYLGELLATGARDKEVRIFDPRAGSVVHSGQAHSGARGPRVCWCKDKLLTVGTGISGDRQMALWDPRDLSKALCTKTIDNGSGVLFPIFDESTGMVYLAGRGDRKVKYYEVSTDSVLQCSEFTFEGDPMLGIAMLPRKILDVGEVEVAKFLRLSGNEVQPASFFLPRNADLKGFFQDDIYGDCLSTESEALTVDDWMAGDTITPVMQSFRPPGMPLVSERVVTREVRSKTGAFRKEIEDAEKEEKQKNDMFLKMQAMAMTHEKYNPNKSMGIKKAGVDATPIYDSDSDGGWSDDD